MEDTQERPSPAQQLQREEERKAKEERERKAKEEKERKAKEEEQRKAKAERDASAALRAARGAGCEVVELTSEEEEEGARAALRAVAALEDLVRAAERLRGGRQWHVRREAAT